MPSKRFGLVLMTSVMLAAGGAASACSSSDDSSAENDNPDGSKGSGDGATGDASSASDSAPPDGSTQIIPSSDAGPALVMYSNGVIDRTKWPASDDYSYGSGTPNDNYKDTTTPQSGHQYDLLVNAASGWQQATDWAESPPNGLDISRYTKLRFDIKPPANSAILVGAHSTRSTGDDLALNCGVDDVQTVPGVGKLTANAWNVGVEIPLCYLGLASSFNYYKFAMQNNGAGNAAFYLDNVELVAGNTAWIYDGDPGVGGLTTGWSDASTSATANYKFAPGTINASVYALNNPPAASAFTGSVSGTTLTVSALTGNIVAGQHLMQFGSSPTVWGTIVSGSGDTWTISGSAGNYSSISSATGWLQSDIDIVKVSTTAKNGTWRASYASGFDLAPYTNFTFAASPTKTGNGYKVQAYDKTGAATGTAITIAPGDLTYTNADRGVAPSGSNFYTVYALPLSALGISGATIGGISIQDDTSNATNVIYITAIGFFS